MLKILVQWILHKTQNRLLQHHVGPLYFWCFASNSAFFRWHMSINNAKWTFAPDVFASSITCFLLLTFIKFHDEFFSKFSHSLSTAASVARIFTAWGIRKIVNLIVMLWWIISFSCNDELVMILPYAVFWIHQLPDKSWESVPTIINALLLLNIQIVWTILETSLYFNGIVNGSFLGKWSLTLVQRDGGMRSFLTWTRTHLSLHRHLEMSHEVVEETLLILRESQCDPLLDLVAAVSRWIFSVPDLLQRFWFVHLRLENEFSSFFGKYHLFRIESFRVDFRCVPRLQLLKVCDQYVTLPNSPPRKERIRGTIQVKLSFQNDGFLIGLSLWKGDSQPMNRMKQ